MKKGHSFRVVGMVHPTEYDWKRQFASCARIVRRTCETERVFDVGKVLGLAEYADELEEKLAVAVKAFETINDDSWYLNGFVPEENEQNRRYVPSVLIFECKHYFW